MSVDLEAPEDPSPRRGRAAARARRSRVIWRVLIVGLVLLIAYVLYGGRIGGPSTMHEVRGELQNVRVPGAFGRGQVEQVVPGYERVQVGGFGEERKRGPAAAVQGALSLTRSGGLLFEVRALASAGEREALLHRSPYACDHKTETELLDTVAGVEVRRVRRGLLFRWLPTSIQLCGTRVEGSVLLHVSGFATDATWHREAAQIRTMLQSWKVDAAEAARGAEGCRMHVAHEPPLYVKFRSEDMADRGEISAETVAWIDLPYRDDTSVGRFTPGQLDSVVGDCAEEQARFALVVEGGADPQSPEAQDAQHAFRARCEPLFPMLRFLGAEQLDPNVLPRPSEGWTQQLDEHYVPALCLPAFRVR